MPWSVTRHPDQPVIVTVYAGTLSLEELEAAARATLEKAQELGVDLLLGDCSMLEGGHSVVDLFYLAESIPPLPNLHRMKEAVVLPLFPDAVENVHFWETACFNRGFTVRVFQEQSEALAWLVAKA